VQSRRPGEISPELREHHDLLLCVSGGKDSTAMALWLHYESGLKNRKFLVWCDTGHEHPHTIDHVHKLADELGQRLWVVRGEYKFVTLCENKRRFPSPKARFCTEDLKVLPMSEWIAEHYGRGIIDHPVLVQGIRRQESDRRSTAALWDSNNSGGSRRVFECPVWRPLIDWTYDEVFDIHAQYHFEPNPLYKMGAKRVGCFPCIFSGKADLRACFEIDPYLIDRLRDYEERVSARAGNGNASFYTSNKIPQRFHDREAVTRGGIRYTYASIDAVYEWAMSDISVLDDLNHGGSCWSHYGLCE
jgi:3'-phosphoadenosine 5'-phosphosulfate sulfotransferase (PAPS reductase)/FAD synthetase